MPASEAASTVARSSVAFHDRAATDLATDARFIERLHRKIRRSFTERGANGIVQLREDFVRMDRRITADTFAADQWALKRMLGEALKQLTAAELEALFILQDVDGDGLVDMAEVAMALRKMFRCTTQQFHDVVRRVRALKIPRERCTFLRTRRPRGGTRSDTPFTRLDVFTFLTNECGTTQSEAFLFLDYCSPHSSDPASSGIGELDCEYVEDVLFTYPLPDNIAFPLLAAKFVEAASDPDKTASGTMGILEACRASGAVQPSVPRVGLDDGDEMEGESPPFGTWLMDVAAMRRFSAAFGSGLSANETDLLFSYICDRARGVVTVDSVVALFAERLLPPPPGDMHVTIAATRAILLEASPFGLVRLFLELAPHGDAPAPLPAFVAAHRQCGVRASLVGDVTLELLHREAPRPVEYLSLLRGELPRPREKLVQQLFDLLDEGRHGAIERTAAFDRLTPVNLERGLVRFDELSDAFAAFLDALASPGGLVSAAEFNFFWGLVSASIEEDARFTMILWKGFNMQSRGGATTPNGREQRSDVDGASSVRSTPLAKTPRRRMLE